MVPGGRGVTLTPSSVFAQEFHRSSLMSQEKRPSFLGNILENLKQEYSKNKELQESLRKFREDAKKLEDSQELKDARKKFESIEGEMSKSSGVLKDQLSGFAEKVKTTFDEVGKNETLKKAGEFTHTLGKKAEGAKKVVEDAAESIGKSGAFKVASNSAAVLREEIGGDALGAKVYRSPAVLRKRKEYFYEDGVDQKPMAANADATGVELHKDSKFYASWESFKENNPVYNKILDYRVKYEASEHTLVRSARLITDKMQDILGGLFTRTELSEVLTEIVKMDPNFCKEQFLKDCERDIIPNILEAMIRGDLEILKDWCHEAAFNVLATPIRQAQQLGYRFDSRILDIESVDLATGKMMDQGPVLVITFLSQQILSVRDAKGVVVEGDPEKVLRVMYVWVLCRDQTELDPKAAWRLLELSANSTEQFL